MPNTLDPLRAADHHVAPVASLLADASRAAMLWSLADGRVRPASELAAIGRIRPSTASAHLARLVDGGLLVVERRGRQRFYRMANPQVAVALEAVAGVGDPGRTPTAGRAVRVPLGLALARSCYDHIAGRVSVLLADALVAAGCLRLAGREFSLGPHAARVLGDLGLDIAVLAREAAVRRRPLARTCLDWSERRYHIAGVLGAALLGRVLSLEWMARTARSRALSITPEGRRALRRLGVEVFTAA
jgi:DNA-binding transcriptional ArsR family regulator